MNTTTLPTLISTLLASVRRHRILALLAAVFLCQALAPESRAQVTVTEKTCSACGRRVDISSQAGQTCPHCSAYWSDEKTSFRSVPDSGSDAGRGRRNQGPRQPKETPMKLTLSARKTWPPMSHLTTGYNHVTVHNHSSSGMWIAFRSALRGRDLYIPSRSNGLVSLPEGKFQIFALRRDRLGEIFEAGTLSLTERPGSWSQQTLCFQADAE